MRRLFTVGIAAILLFSALLTKASITPAQAATISPGCAFMNGSGTDLYLITFSSPGRDNNFALQFYAGETINVHDLSTQDGTYLYYEHYTGYNGAFVSDQTFDGPTTYSLSWTVPVSGYYYLEAGADSNSGDTVTVSCSPASSPASVPVTLFTDGRVNGDVSQAGQTFAAYCNSDFSITVWAINPSNGNGFFAFTATPADIALVPSKPTVDTPIKSGQGATLYRLVGGKFQVNRNETTGKLYSFAFSCGQ